MARADVGKQLGALPPHIFATADAAFRAMGEMRKNQAIIISYAPSALQMSRSNPPEIQRRLGQW